MLCLDYSGDRELLGDLLGDGPAGQQAHLLSGKALDHRQMERYFRTGGGRHHALRDARANCQAPRDEA